MPHLRLRSIKSKTTLWIGGGLVVTLLPCTSYLALQSREDALAAAQEVMASSAKHVSSIVTSHLLEAAGTAQGAAVVFGQEHAQGSLSRDDVIKGLRAELATYPDLTGSWFIEAPGAFDGRQAELQGNDALGANAHGIFAFYWTRGEGSALDFTTFDEDYQAEWWTLSAESGRGAITDPYSDIEIVDARGRPLTHLEASRLLEDAVANLLGRGFHPVALATVLHRTALLHDMVATEMDYGQSRDEARRPQVRLSEHYLAALPDREEWRAHRQSMRDLHQAIQAILPERELANRSSLAMAPGLVRASELTELEAQAAKVSRPEPQMSSEAEADSRPSV